MLMPVETQVHFDMKMGWLTVSVFRELEAACGYKSWLAANMLNVRIAAQMSAGAVPVDQ